MAFHFYDVDFPFATQTCCSEAEEDLEFFDMEF
jgi:hypothetical protein